VQVGSYALQSVRNQYEKYPYPAYSDSDVKAAAYWLMERGLKPHSVIDLGCGTGLWSVAFAAIGSKVTGVDFSNASLAIARKMADRFNVSVEFNRADLFGFETSERFEVVFCNGVLHHTGNARAGFHKISSFVVDNGLLVTSFYNRLSPFRLAKFLVRLLGGDNVEGKKRVAEAVVELPLSQDLLSFMGRSQGGPFSTIQEYTSKDENLVDLLCHAHTSYHTLWEIEQWYHDEGFGSVTTFPDGSPSSTILPNLIFYFGKRVSTVS
jgi:SAM-dependent methyltransferase